MNKFIVEPTDENLKRYRRVQNGVTYWHTADFFQFNKNLEDDLSTIFEAYMDALMESDEEDEEKIIRKMGFSIGRLIVKAAKKAGISPNEYRDQFENYVKVIWTPICIWQKNESGAVNYSLMSSLQAKGSHSV